MKAVRIRAATASDLPGVLACLRSAFAPYAPKYTASAYRATVLTLPLARRRLRSMRVLVATDPSGTIVGTVSIQYVSTRHAHLRGMAVVAARQGTGVATLLLRAAIDRSRRYGARRITLETTLPLRRAARFYRRHGFERTGRIRDWAGMSLIEFELALCVPSDPKHYRE